MSLDSLKITIIRLYVDWLLYCCTYSFFVLPISFTIPFPFPFILPTSSCRYPSSTHPLTFHLSCPTDNHYSSSFFSISFLVLFLPHTFQKFSSYFSLLLSNRCMWVRRCIRSMLPAVSHRYYHSFINIHYPLFTIH